MRPSEPGVKTCNTVSIRLGDLDILATAQTFSIDGGHVWRTTLGGLSLVLTDAVRIAMAEAAQLDANDPEVLDYRRRPTAREMPACSAEVTGTRTSDEEDPEELIPTVVPARP